MPTYEDGYRKGVQDATEPSGHTGDVPVVAAYLNARRKSLLTKKVTKWTGVITSAWSGKPTVLELCDSRQEAKIYLEANQGWKSEPIEIEIEIPL